MTAVPIGSDSEGEVSRLAALARDSHAPVTLVEEDGNPVAVLMGAEEYEGLLETLDILSAPGEREEIEVGRRELEAGEELDGPTVLARYLRRDG